MNGSCLREFRKGDFVILPDWTECYAEITRSYGDEFEIVIRDRITHYVRQVEYRPKQMPWIRYADRDPISA